MVKIYFFTYVFWIRSSPNIVYYRAACLMFLIIVRFPFKLIFSKMDTSKMTSEEESELRFGSWVTSIASNIAESRIMADDFLAAAVCGETNWNFVRLALEHHNNVLHLQQIKADAIAARDLKLKKK